MNRTEREAVGQMEMRAMADAALIDHLAKVLDRIARSRTPDSARLRKTARKALEYKDDPA
jgi:hypothetical protein